jgi:hypothetical protein
MSARLEREPALSERIEYKERLGKTFLSFYQKRGSIFISPIPLVPGPIDPSVVFTGATINGWKGYLGGEEQLPKGGIYTIQRCLRTQNADSFYNTEHTPPFGSFFTMAGVLCPGTALGETYRNALGFLREEIGIPAQNIKVHVSSGHREIKDCVRENTPLDVRIGIDEINYYEWEYGMEGVWGEGLTIAILNKRTGEFEEIGNVVLIKGGEGVPKAVEWGFGLETTTARILSLPHPLYASPIRLFVGEDFLATPVGIRLADSLLAVSALFANGIDFGHPNRNVVRALEKYITSIGFLASLKELSGEEVVCIIRQLVGLISPSYEVSERMIDKLSKYISRANERKRGFLESVMGFLNNPAYKGNLPRLKSVLQRTALNFGFNPLACLGIVRYNRTSFKEDDFNFLVSIWRDPKPAPNEEKIE